MTIYVFGLTGTLNLIKSVHTVVVFLRICWNIFFQRNFFNTNFTWFFLNWMLLLNCFSIVNINGNKKSFPLNFTACKQKQFLRQRKRNCWFKFSFIYSRNVPRNKKYLKMKKLCLNLKILKFRRFIVVNENYELTNLWALFNQILDLKHRKTSSIVNSYLSWWFFLRCVWFL